MKIKTSDLSCIALDWAVAKCEDDEILMQFVVMNKYPSCFSPSSDWSKGGPIIEREKIAIYPLEGGEIASWMPYTDFSAKASKPLIAAMRCYVASKLGEEVEIPDDISH